LSASIAVRKGLHLFFFFFVLVVTGRKAVPALSGWSVFGRRGSGGGGGGGRWVVGEPRRGFGDVGVGREYWGRRSGGVRDGWVVGGDWGKRVWGGFVCQDDVWSWLPADDAGMSWGQRCAVRATSMWDGIRQLAWVG